MAFTFTYEDVVMDIEQARGGYVTMMEPGKDDDVNIVMVEAEPEDNKVVSIDNDGLEMYTHIAEDLRLQELLDEKDRWATG